MVPWGSQGLALGSCSLAAACLPALTAFLPPPGGCDRTARLPSPSQSPELTVWLCPSYPRAQASHPLLLSLGASASVQQSCAGGSHEDLFSAAPGSRGLSPCLTSPFPPLLSQDPWSQKSLCSGCSPLPSGISHGTLAFTGTRDKNLEYQEFPGGSVVQIPGFHC